MRPSISTEVIGLQIIKNGSELLAATHSYSTPNQTEPFWSSHTEMNEQTVTVSLIQWKTKKHNPKHLNIIVDHWNWKQSIDSWFGSKLVLSHN